MRWPSRCPITAAGRLLALRLVGDKAATAAAVCPTIAVAVFMALPSAAVIPLPPRAIPLLPLGRSCAATAAAVVMALPSALVILLPPRTIPLLPHAAAAACVFVRGGPAAPT